MSRASRAGERVTDFVVPTAKIVPLLLGEPPLWPPAAQSYSPTAVYRRDLVGRIEDLLAQIEGLIDGLPSQSLLSEHIFLETPDHEPYSDAYAWKPIQIDLVEKPGTVTITPEAPEFWH